MDVIWEKGEATVGEVLKGLPEGHGLAYNTVLTTLRILEQKGYLRHVKPGGRAFVYQALIGRKQASQNAVRHLVSRFFGNPPGLLWPNLPEDEELRREEIRRIRSRCQDG